MFVNPATILKETIEFTCPICCEGFDSDKHYPMMICSRQHTCCSSCHQHMFDFTNSTVKCHYCREAIVRSQAVPFRLLNEIRLVTEELRVKGSQIRHEIQWLQSRNESVQVQFQKEKQVRVMLQAQVSSLSEKVSYWKLKCQRLQAQVSQLERWITPDNERTPRGNGQELESEQPLCHVFSHSPHSPKMLPGYLRSNQSLFRGLQDRSRNQHSRYEMGKPAYHTEITEKSDPQQHPIHNQTYDTNRGLKKDSNRPSLKTNEERDRGFMKPTRSSRSRSVRPRKRKPILSPWVG